MISLLSKGLSGTTIRKHQFLSAQPTTMVQLSHSYMTMWKNHSVDYTDLCWKSDYLCFLVRCLIPKVSVFTLCNLLPDHIQSTLIHGPNIPGSYSILFFIASDFTFNTRHIHTFRRRFNFGPVTSFLLELLVIALHSSLVTYWTLSNLGGGGVWGPLILWHHNFLHFHSAHGVLQARILEWIPSPSAADHVLSELFTMICLSRVTLHKLLIASLSYTNTFATTRKAVIHEGATYCMIPFI